MGFSDLFYYGVDEPSTPDAIERCRKEAERRRGTGLHMFTAINSKPAQMATRDFIDRPVYNIYVFGGPDNAEVMYARKKGFRPISYWVTATAFPLPYRALTGLYNTRCGFLGSSPWAYQDFPGNGLYDPDKPVHKVSYPDEFGQPIPTLAWEAHRAGIDDVRYLEALDRGIAAAERRLQTGTVPALSVALKGPTRFARRTLIRSAVAGSSTSATCGLVIWIGLAVPLPRGWFGWTRPTNEPLVGNGDSRTTSSTGPACLVAPRSIRKGVDTMIVVTNRIPVASGYEIDFEDRFRNRVHLVDQARGSFATRCIGLGRFVSIMNTGLSWMTPTRRATTR
ncbi:MAG: hypothetical protein CM1200mP2_27280 [Planctomycetaceae bacterium]|nr:MAG: hypothetical protein CM1200mP2_27280 [Planctomycetaceae bacterium]